MEGKREAGGQAQDSKEYCSSDKDIVEVVRTEYVYTRPPPWSDVLPTIHIITPTYSRPVQKAELTRLANTFLHVPNLHWILVEDSQRRTPLVTRLLRETGLNYTHLNVETPRNYKLRGDTRDPRIPRGTMQRNLALRWLRETFNANSSQAGIVYFADDDNTYSLELFEEVAHTHTRTHTCVSTATAELYAASTSAAPRVIINFRCALVTCGTSWCVNTTESARCVSTVLLRPPTKHTPVRPQPCSTLTPRRQPWMQSVVFLFRVMLLEK